MEHDPLSEYIGNCKMVPYFDTHDQLLGYCDTLANVGGSMDVLYDSGGWIARSAADRPPRREKSFQELGGLAPGSRLANAALIASVPGTFRASQSFGKGALRNPLRERREKISGH
jgi:hypothetical protein